MEIVSQDDGGRRYDIPVSWLGCNYQSNDEVIIKNTTTAAVTTCNQQWVKASAVMASAGPHGRQLLTSNKPSNTPVLYLFFLL
jgi:hypothetical protein